MRHLKKFYESGKSNIDSRDLEIISDIFQEMEYELNARDIKTLEDYNNTEFQNQEQVHTFEIGAYKYNLNYHIDNSFAHFTSVTIRDTIRHWKETDSRVKFRPIEKWLVTNIFQRIIDMIGVIIAYAIIYNGADTEVIIYIFDKSQEELFNLYQFKLTSFKVLI